MDAHPQRMRHGVADGSGGRSDRAFAYSKRGVTRAVDQFGPDLRHLAEAQDGIGVPVARGDALVVELDLFLERPAQGLDDTALKLIARAIGVHSES